MTKIFNSILISLIAILIQVSSIQDILSYGAVPKIDTVAAQFVNAQAIKNAVIKANQSSTDRSVRIPKGTFYSMPIVLDQIFNVSIIIEGKLSASRNVTAWPGGKQKTHFIYIRNSSYVEICGGGKIDGRGYKWWILQWTQNKKYWPSGSKRPKLIVIQQSTHFKIHDLLLKNSPSFHLATSQCGYFDIYNIDIKVNTTAQFNLAKRFSIEGVLPTFPLNTDGIDPSGKHYHIWNLTVQNFDDVVVPKPSNGDSKYDCTQFMDVENITVRLGVGLSIGSVSPNEKHNCVRNIAFRNVVIQRPLKGIYIKTNPGDRGSGQIKNISYQNIVLNQSVWWAIYIGPQQQKQPDGGGPGCMLYPFDPKGTCTTQPLIDVRNITLQNVSVHNSLLFPIIIRCNESNPCTDINFKNVKADKWRIGKSNKGYVCQNTKGIQEGGHPRLQCLTEGNSIRSQSSSQNFEWPLNAEIIKQIWMRLEEAVKSTPYEEQDDQMEFSSLELSEF